MVRTYKPSVLVLVAGLTGGLAALIGQAAPPLSSGKQATIHREEVQDPYQPGPGQLRDVSLSSPRTPQGSVQVNVNASGLNIVGDAANEPSIAIDPTNPLRMAIGWRQFDSISSNFRQAGIAYSQDGGLTWRATVLDPGVFRTDPVLDSNSTGNLFYQSLFGSSLTDCDVFKSLDGGVTWQSPVPASGGDKNWMTIDHTQGMGSGHVYCIWREPFSCCGSNIFTRSINDGQTFDSPIPVPQSPALGTLCVAADGVLYAAGVLESDSSAFRVVRSTNARDARQTPTWDPPVAVNMGGSLGFFAGGPNPAGLLGQVWIAAHPTNAAHLYLLCSVDPPDGDPLDVRFARSTNAGQTWSLTVRVNDDPANNNAYQWFGTMSVAPNGRIDAVWNDTRDDPTHQLSRLYYAFSVDEGATWSGNRPLTPQWDSHIGWPNQNKIGDYYHMISYNDAAHLAYAATFNNEQDVYYTRITPLPACATCRGDVNGDGVVNGLDTAAFANCVLRFPVAASVCGCADMSADQVIDLGDVSPFADALLAGGCS